MPLQTLLAAHRSGLRATALSLAIGTAGGGLFALAGLPAPWLSGSGLAAAAAAIAGVRIEVPHWLHMVSLVVLGVIAGSAVTPETLSLMARWPASLAGLAVCVLLIMVSVSRYLERVHGYDRTTAKLAAVPGAMPYVLALASQCPGADTRRVAIIQVVRLAALLILLPTVLTQLGVTRPPSTEAMRPDAPLLDLLALVVLSAIGGWSFERLRIPAAWLLGPMVGAALATGSGAVDNVLPAWLTVPGLVVMGTIVGANFSGLDRQLLTSTLAAGLGSVVVGALAGVAAAIPVAWLLSLPLAQVWLAYAPGGVEMMAIMALALGLDVAYVGGHHAVRFIGLGLAVPFWLREELRVPNGRAAE